MAGITLEIKVVSADLEVQTRNAPGANQARATEARTPRRQVEFYVQDNLALEHLDADVPKADFVYDNSAYNNLRNGKVFEGLLDRYSGLGWAMGGSSPHFG